MALAQDVGQLAMAVCSTVEELKDEIAADTELLDQVSNYSRIRGTIPIFLFVDIKAVPVSALNSHRTSAGGLKQSEVDFRRDSELEAVHTVLKVKLGLSGERGPLHKLCACRAFSKEDPLPGY
jgi:hypothetical protein